METEILQVIDALIKSGAIEKIQSGGQTAIINALLILLTIFSIRFFLINGWVKRNLDRVFTLEEKKIQEIQTLDKSLKHLEETLTRNITDERQKLSDVLSLLNARRRDD